MKARDKGNPNRHHDIHEIAAASTGGTSGTIPFRAGRGKRTKTRGFSLVELLVVILIIAVITAIAVPGIGEASDAARLSKNKRNAQNLASMFATAQAAGVDFYAAGDLNQTMENVVNGGTVSTGAFAGEFFGVPGMGDIERAAAAPYLELNSGMLVYRSDG